MTKTELNAFGKALESKQTELGNGNRSREVLVIDISPDHLCRIQHASENDSAMSNLERKCDRLREVRAALRNMDAGTFGICLGCGENINLKRLAAVPWASSCIVCQEAAEKTPRGQIDALLVMAA
jgi:DnaK suppressor protein